MDENREIRYKITPKFNIIYELGMPTGRKIRTSLFALIVFIILTFIVLFKAGTMSIVNNDIFKNIKIDKFLLILCLIADLITIVRLVGTIIFQSLQYKHVTYTFYDKMMTYEDDFLNQHKKNIEYKNIKEVEIRRTIWDRILDYGIMVVYTNADNDRNNGLVIYSVKNPKSHYEVIDKLIHSHDSVNNVDNISKGVYSSNEYDGNSYNSVNNNRISNIEQSHKGSSMDDIHTVNNSDNPEQDFKESLKNINK